MSIAQHTASFPLTAIAGLASVPCTACGAALIVDSDSPALVLCRACRKAEQESDVISLCQQVRALAEGRDGFELLNVDDRRVALSQLATCLEYARRVTLAVLVVPVSFEAKAIAYAHYVSTAADEPSEEEKAAIYAMEEIIDREETVAADWR
jgi:hypothetical protein